MRKQRLFLGIASVLLLLAFTSVDNNVGADIENEVKTFFESGVKAFNAHDLDLFMNHFHNDFEMYTPMTGWLRGLPAVKDRFSMVFEQNPMVKMDIEELKVRKIASNSAVVDFKWKVYPTGEGPAYHGITTGVYVLREGEWGEVLEVEHVTGADEELTPNSQ